MDFWMTWDRKETFLFPLSIKLWPPWKEVLSKWSTQAKWGLSTRVPNDSVSGFLVYFRILFVWKKCFEEVGAILCDFVRFCAIWCDLVRFGAIWWDFVGFGDMYLLRFGAIWWDLVRFGAIWWHLKRIVLYNSTEYMLFFVLKLIRTRTRGEVVIETVSGSEDRGFETRQDEKFYVDHGTMKVVLIWLIPFTGRW
jgi:hypothetical protein